ncbi:hypothetical protein D4R42_00195 [bacterium]|nr:MAG: hypothetical protein D4R42_00195 [bacterium]
MMCFLSFLLGVIVGFLIALLIVCFLIYFKRQLEQGAERVKRKMINDQKGFWMEPETDLEEIRNNIIEENQSKGLPTTFNQLRDNQDD